MCGDSGDSKERRQSRATLEGKRLAVWSLHQFAENQANGQRLEVFWPSYQDNPNLRLQSGVLTYLRLPEGIPPESPTDRRSLYEVIGTDDPGALQYLNYVTLPYRSAPELLGRLRVLGYSAGTLFDGFSGAVKDQFEHSMLTDLLHMEEFKEAHQHVNEKSATSGISAAG